MSQNSPGHTLLELMITLSLMLILLGTAAVNVGFLSSTSVRSDIDLLYAACSCMQQQAMSTNKEQYLMFDAQQNSYDFNGHHQRLSQHTHFGTMPQIKGPPGNPTDIVRKPITFKKNQIIFYPNGIISAGTVYLTDTKQRVQYALSSSVAQVSCMRTYGYNHGWIPRS